MSEADILIEERERVLTVTLNRPDKLNALNGTIFEGIAEAVDMMVERDDLQVLLIRANGRYFSAGLDISGGQGGRGTTEGGAAKITPDFDDPISARRWYRGTGSPSPRSLADAFEILEKPVVVAAHAPCLGGALEFTLSADFRLAAESAEFGLPEVQLGVLPGSGGISRLTRLVGPAWARWLVLVNQSVTAERALTMGLVQDVYPDDEFDDKVWEFVTHLASMPPQLFGIGKLAIELCADLDRQQGRNVEVIANGQLFLGEEYERTIEAFTARQAAKKAQREAHGE
jgi:enoyl-CoA hydratase